MRATAGSARSTATGAAVSLTRVTCWSTFFAAPVEHCCSQTIAARLNYRFLSRKLQHPAHIFRDVSDVAPTLFRPLPALENDFARRPTKGLVPRVRTVRSNHERRPGAG